MLFLAVRAESWSLDSWMLSLTLPLALSKSEPLTSDNLFNYLKELNERNYSS